MLGTITPDQIRATADKHVCGYIRVSDVNDSVTHVQYGNKKDLDKKIEETIKSIASLPDQVFKVTFCKSMSGKNKAEYCYYLQKNSAATPASSSPQTIINTPFEPARTMSEALKDATALAETKAENKRLQDELDRMKLQLMRIEEDEEEDETMKEGDGITQANQLMGFAKEVLPQFLPLIDRHYELKAKQLELQAMAMNRQQQQAPLRSRRAGHPFRPFWSPEDQEKTASYFDYLDKLPDDKFYQELTDLQNNAPALYIAVAQEFNLNNNEEEAESR